MKCTDFSKLHLAKRVYFRDPNEDENLKSIIKSNENKWEQELFFITLEHGWSGWYELDGRFVTRNCDFLDIIAFEIDEPLDVDLASGPDQTGLFRKLQEEGKIKIVDSVAYAPSEERSAYIEKIANAALEKSQKEWDENLERAHKIVEEWPEWKKKIRLTANSPERKPELITMQFTVEEIELLDSALALVIVRNDTDAKKYYPLFDKLKEYLK